LKARPVFQRRVATLAMIASSVAALLTPGPRLAAPHTATFQIEEATIEDIQSAILKGDLTSTQVVQLYLHRIKAYDGPCVNQPEGILGPFTTIKHAGQLNALITVNLRPANRLALGLGPRKARSMTDPADTDPEVPDALEVAAKQDAYFKSTGKLVGPLHGIVFAVKDWYDTFDMRTTAGADVAYANDRPPRDAAFITRMRDAGAIILAKANVGTGISRSPFGGVSCNPYDTERSAGTSSSGSGSSVAANLVTCAIAEETGGSILHPTKNNMVVGLAPTQELVSRNGMYDAGYNTRVGPICRTVQDAAKVLDVIAGYDPKDELTVFSVGRLPLSPYQSFANETWLDGIRIGVIREYMDRKLFNQADTQSIDATERAITDLERLGATIVDPGPGGALLQKHIDKYAPPVLNKLFINRFPDAFPVEARKPSADHVASLVDMFLDPSLTPGGVTLRSLRTGQTVGESRYMLELYLRERGDAKIKTVKDLDENSKPLTDTRPDSGPNARPGGGGPENSRDAMTLDNANRWLTRFAVQQIVLQAMEEMHLDAMVCPTGNIPPYMLGQPLEPMLNGRGPSIWSFLGTQGFPELGVPAGFTTEVYDRVRDASAPGGTRLVGPISATLPLSVMFFGRPFGEPVLFRIASAYERATHHRMPPPDFGPLPVDPGLELH
jgi:Asp-tRNA(Asn)/Glu-tRNA(Gln) amidotransferase A subunit family amidase